MTKAADKYHTTQIQQNRQR